MKTTIKLKPRNPLVAPARSRVAGAHGAFDASRRRRRDEKLSLRRQLNDFDKKGGRDA